MTRISEAVECLESLGYVVTAPRGHVMTERQAKAWPEYVAEAREFAPGIRDTGYGWVMDWRDEVRPGRGNDLSALWSDGEHFVQITLDVYGYGSVSVAETSWLHNSADEECATNNGCDRCARLNAAEPLEPERVLS